MKAKNLNASSVKTRNLIRDTFASIITKKIIAIVGAMKKDLVIECVPEQEKTKHLALSNGFTYTGNIDHLDVFRLKVQT